MGWSLSGITGGALIKMCGFTALPDGDAITIDMLLRHTSGLFDYVDVDGDGESIYRKPRVL